MRHFHAAKLVDLGKSAEEAREAMGLSSSAVEKPSVTVYPWGSCIRLEDDVLGKVMPGETPPVGSMVHGCFVGMVKASTPATERIDAEGKKTSCGACVEIEIRQLGFAAEDDVDRQLETSEARQQTWYGEKDDDGA